MTRHGMTRPRQKNIEAGRRSGQPRIEQGDTGRLEVGDVARDDRETVHHRRRGDQCIASGAGIWPMIRHVKPRATLRHGGVDRENAGFEARQKLIVDPRAQDRPLRRVPSGDQQRAELDLEIEIADGRSLPPGSCRPRSRHCGLPCPAA